MMCGANASLFKVSWGGTSSNYESLAARHDDCSGVRSLHWEIRFLRTALGRTSLLEGAHAALSMPDWSAAVHRTTT
jgi:hypothetical protein